MQWGEIKKYFIKVRFLALEIALYRDPFKTRASKKLKGVLLMCKENYGGIYDSDLDVNADGKVSEEEFLMGLDGMTLNGSSSGFHDPFDDDGDDF